LIYVVYSDIMTLFSIFFYHYANKMTPNVKDLLTDQHFITKLTPHVN